MKTKLLCGAAFCLLCGSAWAQAQYKIYETEYLRAIGRLE